MNFCNVLGQDKVISILQSHLKKKRVHHAYLFYGPEGVGKTLTARAFAASLLCLEEETDSCTHCGACLRFAAGSHPDYTEILPEDGSILIDQMREMRRSVAYRPYESSYRVFVIQEAHTMTSEAANSLLKVLEEPPAYVVIILITSNQDLLLPTIRSRSVPIAFSYIPDDTCKNELRGMADDELIEVVVGLARGSLGLAKSYLQDEELLNKRQDFLRKFINMKKDSFLAIYQLFSWMEKEGKEFFQFFLQVLHLWFRDLILITQGRKEGLYNVDFALELEEQAQNWKSNGLEKSIAAVEETSAQLRKQGINQQLAIEALLLKINGWRK